MLADLFYLAAVWLVLSFVLLLLRGNRTPRNDFFSSIIYLAVLLWAGDFIAVWWLGESVTLTVAASAVVLVLGAVLILLLRDRNAPGQAFMTFSLATSVVYLAYAFTVTAFTPASPLAYVFSFMLFLLETCALALSLSYAFEVLDVICRVRWRRQIPEKSLGKYAPMVSLHVPAYNEPPELVEQTLRSLARLDYPSYEVILVDNNTPTEAAWQPLAKVCKELGFKCLHLDQWPGYKSGALNFALAMTDPKAEIVGVVDADYIVEPGYLRRVVPYFDDPQMAFVQTPQDYRDSRRNRFFQAAYDGYRYFFELSMPCRHERNAIIFCGTMGLLRKTVLQEIGGWDEWCITEDAEASLRILDRGYESLYVNETFGRGLMPLNLEGLKKQRFRWAFGGIQVLKKHWGKLMPWSRWVDPHSKLTGAQRYFYLMSGLQWFNELFTFAFTIMVLISALLTITDHTAFLRPTVEAFAMLPVVLIGTNLLRAAWGLRLALGISWTRAFYALTLWFSLTWAVTLACVQALIRKRGVFLRTPKGITNAPWARAIQASSWETLLGGACLLAGLVAVLHAPSWLTVGLLLLCISQAVIYLSAPLHSLLSLENMAGQNTSQPDRADIAGSIANEARMGLQVALIAVTLVAFAFTASLIPGSDEVPWWYQYFNPDSLIVPEAKPGRKPHPQHPNKPKGPQNQNRIISPAARQERQDAG